MKETREEKNLRRRKKTKFLILDAKEGEKRIEEKRHWGRRTESIHAEKDEE